jgi:type II secretory pathway pseudopilin PulG
MRNLLKPMVLGVGLLVGVSATAYAQSVSNVPPTSPATAPTATTVPTPSTAKIYPNPGTNGSWQEEHYKATETDNDPARQPYSKSNFGPRPN